MKKIIYIITISVAIISFCFFYQKKALPMPEYPLDKATVEAGLKKVGFSWEITYEEVWGEGRIFYELYNTDGKLISIISSVNHGGTRLLQVTFLSDTELCSSLPEEDWEKAVRLAAILYGGYEDDKQVYNSFVNTYEEKALVDAIPGTASKGQERIRWNHDVNNTQCFIGFRRSHTDSASPQTELVMIQISNS